MRCFVKGAPDVLMDRSSRVGRRAAMVRRMRDRERGLSATSAGASRGAGDGVARRDYDSPGSSPGADLLERCSDLTMLAMVGIVDPPAPR